MLCVTGRERSLAALAERLERHDRDDRIHEVRLDFLETIDDELFALLGRRAARLLISCRPERQGGSHRGGEAERLTLLRRAAAAGVRYVDVEADVADDDLHGIDPRRRVLSWHDFDGIGADLPARVRSMAARSATVVKVAARVGDPSDLLGLLDLRTLIDRDAVVIGMGDAGVLSRVRYRAMGSTWTYVTAGEPTAAGQLDLAAAERLGLPAAAETACLALVGGPSVGSSPGVEVYNALLRRLELPHSYIALCCRSLAEVLPLLARLEVSCLSVTMPHKLAALALCDPDDGARRVGAVNSLRLLDGRWRGRNSDVTGVREPLAHAMSRSGCAGPVLVLGAGGAARAAVEACRQLGLAVTVSARREERALALGVDTCPWEERTACVHDVLINATSVSSDDSPWPDGQPLAPVVFDLAMGARRLPEQARDAGSTVVSPLDMWRAQGAEQMSWFLDRPVTVDQLCPDRARAEPS